MSLEPMGNEPNDISLSFVPPLLLDNCLTLLESTGPKEVDNRARQLAHPSFAAAGANVFKNAISHNEQVIPIRSILRIVRKRYNCFALVEHPYLDLEEWSNYAVFYAKSFIRHERLCSRVHFFEGDEKNARILIDVLMSGSEVAFADQLRKLQLKYRGFCVLRPGKSFNVGRTAIEFDIRGPQNTVMLERHPLETDGQPYCTADVPNRIHLGGTHVVVQAPPFVQQNPAIGVCATASLWAASQVLAARFGLHKFSYDTITRQAIGVAAARTDWKFGKGLAPQEAREAQQGVEGILVGLSLRRYSKPSLRRRTPPT